MVGELAERVSELLGRPVHVAFVDVLGPTPEEVLRALPADRPVTVVPAFLASGYHVRVDLPAHVAASGHPAVTVTDAARPVPEHGAGAGTAARRMRLAARRLGGHGGGGHVGCACAVRSAADGGDVVGGDRRPGRAGLRGYRRATGRRRGGRTAATRRKAGRGGVIPVGGRAVSRSTAQQRSRSRCRSARRPSGDGAVDRQPVQARPGTAARVVRRRRTCGRPPRWNRCAASTPSPAGRRLGRRQDRNGP